MTNPVEIPDLSGVATKDLVEQIGSGSFKASYINWSRTMHLLRTHAPGWMCEAVFATDGGLIHRSPVGGYLLLRFRHVSGFATPEVPQAIMDHRNNSIPFEKITSRDVTDTQRRGACLVAAMQFGLAYELWAKMPLESGYGSNEPSAPPASASKASPKAPATKTAKAASEPSEPSEVDFRQVAKTRGLTIEATDALIAKTSGKYKVGTETLNSKYDSWVEAQNAQFQEEY